jgi:hypothetical protein
VQQVGQQVDTQGVVVAPGIYIQDVVLWVEVEQACRVKKVVDGGLGRPEAVEGEADAVEGERGLPRLAADPEQRAKDGAVAFAADLEVVVPAADDPTERVAVCVKSVAVLIALGTHVHLDHAVLAQEEQPDVQPQLGGEAGKEGPGYRRRFVAGFRVACAKVFIVIKPDRFRLEWRLPCGHVPGRVVSDGCALRLSHDFTVADGCTALLSRTCWAGEWMPVMTEAASW